jgi:hypothetical protein
MESRPRHTHGFFQNLLLELQSSRGDILLQDLLREEAGMLN